MGYAIDKISKVGLVPVVVDALTEEGAIGLGQALLNGGIPVAEITFRSEGAETTIVNLRKHHKDLLVGAGTILTVEQAEIAIQSGAQFIVAPGLNENVVKVCQLHGVDIMPGVSTATEIEAALELGLTTLKFFPSSLLGGVSAMKALNGPYKAVKFVPTGGISITDLGEYSSHDGIAAVGGTFMLGNHVALGEWDAITNLCKQSIQALLGIRLAHVGINSSGSDEALDIAQAIANLTLLPLGKDGNSSIFVDKAVEVMKIPYFGTQGHIGFSCHNVRRTSEYLKSIGIKMNDESSKWDSKGNLTAIYLEKEVAGFAIHLVK